MTDDSRTGAMTAGLLTYVTSAARTTLDVLFPRSCVVCCAAIDGEGLHLCNACARKLDLLAAGPFCPRCGHSVGPYGVRDGACRACAGTRPWLDGLVRVGPYRDPLDRLVRAFKYAGRDELDQIAGGRIAQAIEHTSWKDSVDAFVCVPTHWTHSLGRKHYAPKLLIRVVSRETGIPSAPVLRRLAGGPHQFDLPHSQRKANIHGKFGLVRGAGVASARLCLIDDVSTVGATLNECARVLKQAGAAAVYGAVVAKVDTAHRDPTPGV